MGNAVERTRREGTRTQAFGLAVAMVTDVHRVNALSFTK
jgi:hypothetical protein